MKLRSCATKPMGMAGTSAFAFVSSTIKPWSVRIGETTLAYHTANDTTGWSMGPAGGSTG